MHVHSRQAGPCTHVQLRRRQQETRHLALVPTSSARRHHHRHQYHHMNHLVILVQRRGTYRRFTRTRTAAAIGTRFTDSTTVDATSRCHRRRRMYSVQAATGLTHLSNTSTARAPKTSTCSVHAQSHKCVPRSRVLCYTLGIFNNYCLLFNNKGIGYAVQCIL